LGPRKVDWKVEPKAYFNTGSHRRRDRRRIEDTSERKTFAVQVMWNTHHEIVRMALLGKKGTEIARELGLSPVTVSYTLNSPMVKEKLAIMQAARDCDAIKLSQQITETAHVAIEYCDALLRADADSISTSTKVNVALGVLKLAVPQKVEGRMLHAHTSVDLLEEIKERGKAAARAMGLLVEEDRSVVDVGV
jgi:hypothetical protein